MGCYFGYAATCNPPESALSSITPDRGRGARPDIQQTPPDPMEKPPSLLSRTSSLNIEDTDFDWLRGYLLREHSKASGDLEILKDDNLTPQMLSGTKHRMSSVDLMASKVLPPDTPLWESPAQDEDDLYDLLHDEIAASRSRPRPGGAEDDEGQRQDTKVRATPPPQAASDARPTGGPVARSG